jgi:hypothetical protein
VEPKAPIDAPKFFKNPIVDLPVPNVLSIAATFQTSFSMDEITFPSFV